MVTLDNPMHDDFLTSMNATPEFVNVIWVC